jgi:hypothetical protein
MDPRPFRYRLEYHREGAPPRILRRLTTLTAASAALKREARRLAATGAGGWVVLIDQEAVPEVVLLRRPIEHETRGRSPRATGRSPCPARGRHTKVPGAAVHRALVEHREGSMGERTALEWPP